MSPSPSESDAPEEPEPHPYELRATDHLVEPMFAGLGVEADEDEDAATDTEPAPGLLTRIWRALFGAPRR